MTFVRSRVAFCLAAISLSLASSCSTAPSTHTNARTPVATSAEGEPIFQLSENELINVFRNVQVRYHDAYPPVSETFGEDGRYSAGGEYLQEGRFWVANGELCAKVEGQTGATLCRRFGRSADGGVYEISGSRGRVTIPYKYDLSPVASVSHR